jgi:hypothetical protein
VASPVRLVAQREQRREPIVEISNSDESATANLHGAEPSRLNFLVNCSPANAGPFCSFDDAQSISIHRARPKVKSGKITRTTAAQIAAPADLFREI